MVSISIFNVMRAPKSTCIVQVASCKFRKAKTEFQLIRRNVMQHTKKLALSSLTIALYIVLMYFTQSFSFGQYQVRLATGLYSLAYYFPYLCVPLGLANMLSNILFSGDFINGILGFIAGTLTCVSICLLKKITTNKIIVVAPIALIPSLIIPIWLSYTIHMPYFYLVVSLLVGQTISAYTMGLFVLTTAKRII